MPLASSARRLRFVYNSEPENFMFRIQRLRFFKPREMIYLANWLSRILLNYKPLFYLHAKTALNSYNVQHSTSFL